MTSEEFALKVSGALETLEFPYMLVGLLSRWPKNGDARLGKTVKEADGGDKK